MEAYNEPEPEFEEEEIAEPDEVEIHPHSSLSMLEILKLNLGEFMFRNRYPIKKTVYINNNCLLYTSPSPRDQRGSRMPSSA